MKPEHEMPPCAALNSLFSPQWKGKRVCHSFSLTTQDKSDILMKARKAIRNFTCLFIGLIMDSERNIQRLIFLLLLVGITYFSYTMYYSVGQLQPITWNNRPAKSIEPLYEKDPELAAIHQRMVREAKTLSNEITLVTAYFDLGRLNKGGVFNSYTPDRYKRWMSVFSRIENPLIVFTDSPDVVDIFKDLRNHGDTKQTTIVLVNRTQLWAFMLAPKIRDIYNQPGYPSYDPNTVNENYSCVMHAKFELVNKVIKEKMFHTKYVGWIDIGLYRAIVSERHHFPIRLPHGFDPEKVSYSGQHRFDYSLSPYQIIVEDKTWVGGAMFLGKPEVLYIYTQDYMRAVEKLISERMMSTDQQVIYIMYQPSFHFDPRVELQLYTTHSTDDWFYLGYMIKESWDYSRRKTESLARFLLSLL